MFWKKWFKKPPQKFGITLEQLPDWFDTKTQHYYEEAKEVIESHLKTINDSKKHILETAQKLQAAPLRNDKISAKERQIMEGNRDFYLSRLTLLVDELDFGNLEAGVQASQELLADFTKQTLKAYRVLQHFYKDEVYAVAQNIKNLDAAIKDMDGVLNATHLKETESIRAEIKTMFDKIKAKRDFKGMSKETKEILAKLNNELETFKIALRDLEQSREYKEYHRYNVEEYKAQEQLDDIREAVSQLFAPLQHSLRKFAALHSESEQLVSSYLEKPLDSLLKDEQLTIISVLTSAVVDVETGKLELKDKKKDKVLSSLKEITSDRLTAFVTEYKKLSEQIASFREHQEAYTVMSDVEAAQKKIHAKEQEISTLESRFARETKEHEEIDVQVLKQNVIFRVNKLLGVELHIE